MSDIAVYTERVFLLLDGGTRVGEHSIVLTKDDAEMLRNKLCLAMGPPPWLEPRKPVVDIQPPLGPPVVRSGPTCMGCGHSHGIFRACDFIGVKGPCGCTR